MCGHHPFAVTLFFPNHFQKFLSIAHFSQGIVLEHSNMIWASTCVKTALAQKKGYIVACKLSDISRPGLYHDISDFLLGNLRLFPQVSRTSAKTLKQIEVTKKNILIIPQVCEESLFIYKNQNIWRKIGKKHIYRPPLYLSKHKKEFKHYYRLKATC